LHKGPFKHIYTPFWNKECAEAKLKRKLAEKVLRKNPNPDNLIDFKRCKSKFHICVKKAKKLYWENYCASLNYHSKIANIWNTIKNLKNPNKSKKIVLSFTSGILLDDKSIANKFASNFFQLSKTNNE